MGTDPHRADEEDRQQPVVCALLAAHRCKSRARRVKHALYPCEEAQIFGGKPRSSCAHGPLISIGATRMDGINGIGAVYPFEFL